jgi:ABC-type transporter Mla MlaB component
MHESDKTIEMALAGRLTGPWVSELDRAWKLIAPQMAKRKLLLDVRDLTYSDTSGMQVLRDIFRATHAQFRTSSIWSQHLAAEVSGANEKHGKGKGVEHENHA